MEEGSPLNKGGHQPLGTRKGLIKTLPQNLALQGAHLRGLLLPGHSGGPCCGWTRPTPSAGTQSHVCTGATDLSELRHILPCGGQVQGGLCLGPLAGSMNAPRELVCPCWANEVGAAGPAVSPTPCLCLPFPSQLSPSPLSPTCFCPLFSSLAKSPRLPWSLTSCFN